VKLHIVYFAWVRERIGLSTEDIELPGPLTLSALADLLAARSEGHALALADRGRLRAAVNQQFSGWDTVIGNSSEIAFFPPVTGGY
jgi:molybdopterin converting factor subunit 1